MPTVSVIVPIFNQEPFLSRTLESVLAQTAPDWECVMVDDGSTDTSPETCSRYVARDRRFRYLRKPNGGVSSARNAGLDAAQGTYVLFLDGDDTLVPNAIESAIAFMKCRPDADACYGKVALIDEQDRPAGALEGEPQRGDYIEILLLRNPFHTSSLVFRRQILAGVRFDATIAAGGEDWEMWFRLAMHGCRYARLDEPFVHYRQHEASATRDAGKVIRNFERTVNTFFDPAQNRLSRQQQSLHHMALACMYIRLRWYARRVGDETSRRACLSNAAHQAFSVPGTQANIRHFHELWTLVRKSGSRKILAASVCSFAFLAWLLSRLSAHRRAS